MPEKEQNIIKQPHNLNLKLSSFGELTKSQNDFSYAFHKGKRVIGGLGFAGTGKTTLALYLALKSLISKDSPIKHVKIIRSIVPVRQIGFTKGDTNEKEAPYNIYTCIVNKLFKNDNAWDKLLKNRSISFVSTTFEQGKTYEDTIIIVDEVQNLTFNEIDLAITRIGNNSQLLLTGDLAQTYLKNQEKKDILIICNIIEKLINTEIIYYTFNDIVRDDFLKEYIVMREHILNKEPLPTNMLSKFK